MNLKAPAPWEIHFPSLPFLGPISFVLFYCTIVFHSMIILVGLDIHPLKDTFVISSSGLLQRKPCEQACTAFCANTHFPSSPLFSFSFNPLPSPAPPSSCSPFPYFSVPLLLVFPLNTFGCLGTDGENELHLAVHGPTSGALSKLSSWSILCPFLPGLPIHGHWQHLQPEPLNTYIHL